MKRKLISLSAMALVAGSALFAQSMTEPSSLNEDVYQIGLDRLVSEGYDLGTVSQDAEGNLTFEASDGAQGRILILDSDGDVLRDERINAPLLDDKYDAAEVFPTVEEADRAKEAAAEDGGVLQISTN
ncbi:MAG: hypothetical protein VX874_21765 [Pseudomonadota bacterium]|nr:hypothetical protein [Pseudomonadota bacterium]